MQLFPKGETECAMYAVLIILFNSARNAPQTSNINVLHMQTWHLYNYIRKKIALGIQHTLFP